MSLSKGGFSRRINPATPFFIEWKSKKEGWFWYDKDAGEDKRVVNLQFQLLDDSLQQLKGYSETEKAQSFSNSIRNPESQAVTIKTYRNGKQIDTVTGYANDKNKKSEFNAYKLLYDVRFCKNVYATMLLSDLVGNTVEDADSTIVTVCINMAGSSLSPWFEFRSSMSDSDLQKHFVLGNEFRETKKGDNIFNEPVFKLTQEGIPFEYNEVSYKKDEELQSYLDDYFKQGGEKEVEVDNSTDQTSQHKAEDENQDHKQEEKKEEPKNQNNAQQGKQDAEHFKKADNKELETPWREFVTKKGKLGAFSLDDLCEARDMLKADGYSNLPVYIKVCEGIQELNEQTEGKKSSSSLI